MNLFAPNATDFYKTSHKKMFPLGTTKVYSNLTPRSDKWFSGLEDFDHKVVFYGLQGVLLELNDLWNDSFFYQEKDYVIRKYKRRMDASLGEGTVDVKCFEDLHDLGYLPIKVKALPEGSRVNIKVPVFTIVNTHPEFFWLTNYLETQLSAMLWKPMTTATTAHEYRRLFEKYAALTGAPEWFIDWQGHDFSARGMSGIEDAARSGSGHLLSFSGTDTISAIDYADDYYGINDLAFGSVPASEHAVMSMGGKESEIDTFTRLLELFPKGILSVVSDTWDFWQVITEYSVTLKDKILSRDGKLVFRPDSGDPVKIIVGDPDAEIGTPAWYGAVECLWKIFGGSISEVGEYKVYKVLDSHVGLIYGDSITIDRAKKILEGLEKKGFASNNIVFGIGSYTYQMCSRDTLGTAVKATYGEVNGEPRELFKAPKTDSGTKNSARGLLRVEKQGDDFVLYDQQTGEQEMQGELRKIFEDGQFYNRESFDQIKSRLKDAGVLSHQ